MRDDDDNKVPFRGGESLSFAAIGTASTAPASAMPPRQQQGATRPVALLVLFALALALAATGLCAADSAGARSTRHAQYEATLQCTACERVIGCVMLALRHRHESRRLGAAATID